MKKLNFYLSTQSNSQVSGNSFLMMTSLTSLAELPPKDALFSGGGGAGIDVVVSGGAESSSIKNKLIDKKYLYMLLILPLLPCQ